MPAETHVEGAPIGRDEVLELIRDRLADILEDIAADHPGRVYRGTRAGELRHSTLDVSRFADRGWAPRHALKDGLRETYRFIVTHKNGA